MEEERRGLAAVLSVTVIFRCSVRHSVHPPLGVPELTLCRLHIGLLVSCTNQEERSASVGRRSEQEVQFRPVRTRKLQTVEAGNG